MNKSIIAIVLLLVLALSLIGFLYYYYEVDKQEEMTQQAYANIYAYDNNMRRVKTGYKIIIGGKEYKNGTTRTLGGIKESVPVNRTVVFRNYNLEEQNFYIDNREILINEPKNYLIDLNLKEAGEIRVEWEEKLRSDKNELTLKFSTDSFIQHPAICLEKSDNFLYVDLYGNFTKLEDKPERFEFFNKCFEYNEDNLSEEELMEVELNYLLFDKLKEEDFIKLVIFDGNIIDNQINYDEEMGREDFVYNITK